jgi:hypothetical protein
MSKKLLLAAIITFLSIAVGAAFYCDGSLAGARPYHFGNVVIYSIFTFPLAAAIVVWEHRSSRALKYWSAGAGLVITLTVAWIVGPVPATSSELKISGAVLDRLIFIMSCFILSSSLMSLAGRISIRLWALFRYLGLKVKNLGRVLGKGFAMCQRMLTNLAFNNKAL